MRLKGSRSSRSAYLFVTLSLVVLLVFLISSSENLRDVQATLSEYDQLLHEWFQLRLALPPADGTVAVLPEFQTFAESMNEMTRSPALEAAGRLSDQLRASLTRATAAWSRLSAEWLLWSSADGSLYPGMRDREVETFQSLLSTSRVELETFVLTQERAMWVLLYCLGATIVLVVVVFVVVESENERARRRALRTRVLAQNAIEIQERERERIAHGLHDSLAQELSLAILETETLAESTAPVAPDSEEVFSRISERLRRCVAWARNTAYELRPAELDTIGLGPAISEFCAERAAASDMSFTWEIGGECDRLTAGQAINIYRIAQEAVTNALQHSGGKTLRLELELRPERVDLVVSDDGRGFQVGSDSRHRSRYGLGLAGLEERARMINANVRVRSTRGRGTTVTLTVTPRGTHKKGNSDEPD